MVRKAGELAKFTELRRQAELVLRDRIAHSPTHRTALPAEEALRALQELSVNQIELEMQNEELQRLLAEVESEHERYANFYDLSPVGFGSVSDQGIFLEANLTLARMLDIPRSDLVGLPISRFIFKNDLNSYDHFFQGLLKTNQPQTLNIHLIHGLKGIFWVSVAAISVVNSKGMRVCRLVVTDISERIQADEALRISEKQFDTAFQFLPVAACITDYMSGLIVAVNGHYSEMYGYGENDLLGHTAAELSLWANPADRDQILSMIKRGLSVHCHEIQMRGKSGSLFWVAYSAKRAKLHGMDCLISGAVDISQRKEGEATILRMKEDLEQRVRERTAELEAANLELEAFSYSVSHDLRNPLQSIQGYSDLLLEEHPDRLDPIVKQYLARIRLGAQRMSEIIEDLLELSKANHGKLVLSEIDLSGLCGKVVESLTLTSHAARRFQVSVQPGMSMLADSSLMRILIENLLGNAWKFTSRTEQPRIEVGEGVGPEGERTFFIRDNGDGFDMTQADRLFKAFQRLHAASDFEGTGIGLTIAQRIIHRHGGRIWAEAEPGKGATFYFTIPEPDGG